MRKTFAAEFVYQVFSLLLAVIIVHAIYVAVIRPNADEDLEREIAAMRANPDHVPERSLYVLIRDFEQETCFILMLWAFAIMGFKGVSAHRERRLLESDLVPESREAQSVESYAAELSRRLRALPDTVQGFLLPRALGAALQRYAATGHVQDVSAAAREVCTSEGERLESELSIIRYVAWAIPSIGFIGTVRGIGEALGQAHRAVEGDITGVTQSLGVAFNSTLIALLISLVVMFFVHQLQLVQERLVLDTEQYCDQHLVRYLR